MTRGNFTTWAIFNTKERFQSKFTLCRLPQKQKSLISSFCEDPELQALPHNSAQMTRGNFTTWA
ncbi:MAG: hypothetical protein EA392_13030 [Cryomorphaceae bacterium]|nr:MAG: hypothetical protein EA392_13030 [Cryomorphaceae bacterium]